MTPRRRTAILVLLTLGTALILVPALDLGFQWTIGGTWSHNHALDTCALTPPGAQAKFASTAVGISATDRWTWWLPGHAHRCVYELPGGKAVVRPVPPVPK